MSNWLWPIKVLFKLKADLTKPAEDITGMAKDTHKGVGKFFYALLGPWIEERIGKAKRGAAQAEKDSLDILAGHARVDEETKTMISIGNVSSVDALCEELEKANSQCKAKRLAAALMAASIEMKQVPEDEVADEPLNQTFFNHWRAEAELIDDEDLRQWWAHLLVEETKKPKSISPRTLDVAKNLSQYEAKLFAKLSIGVKINFLLTNDVGVPVLGRFGDILTLQDAGLLNPQSSVQTQEIGDEAIGKIYFIFEKAGYGILISSQKQTFLEGYGLTSAGKELYNILSSTQAALSTMIEIATIISQNNGNCTVSVHKITSISAEEGDDKTVTLSDDPVWSNELTQTSGENSK